MYLEYAEYSISWTENYTPLLTLAITTTFLSLLLLLLYDQYEFFFIV